MELELEQFIHAIEVNNRMFGDDMDKSEEYEGNKVYLIFQLTELIDREVAAAIENHIKFQEALKSKKTK